MAQGAVDGHVGGPPAAHSDGGREMPIVCELPLEESGCKKPVVISSAGHLALLAQYWPKAAELPRETTYRQLFSDKFWERPVPQIMLPSRVHQTEADDGWLGGPFVTDSSCVCGLAP
jgi:hypothetical protein